MNKSIINFIANNQSLESTEGCYAINTVNYIEAHFTLGENWSGFDSVRAIWTNGHTTMASVLNDGVCVVPWEVLTGRFEVKVNLVGSTTENNELVDRLTTEQIVAFTLCKNALIEGSNSAAPTPSEYEQFVQNVHDDADRAEQARDEAEQALADTEQIKTDVENLKTQTLAIKVETETLKNEVEDLVNGFDEDVTEALSDINNAKTTALNDIGTEKASALSAITDEKTIALGEITSAKSSALSDITSSKASALTDIQTEGTTQKNLVTAEGQTQVGNVQTEGQTQITAIENKGAEVIANIPNFAPIITDTAEGEIVSFTDGADGYPMKSVKVSLEPIQSGTGDPSPSNIRPISGWSGVNVNRTGVNVWDEEWEHGFIDLDTGEAPTGYRQRLRSKNFIPASSNTTYYFHDSTGFTGWAYAYYYDINKQYLGRNAGMRHNATFTTVEGTQFIKFALDDAWSGKDYTGGISINYPSTDTSYQPYQGSSYSIPFKDSEYNPITVYGGTLDAVSGKLVIDRVIKELDGSSDELYYTSSTYGMAFRTYITGIKTILTTSLTPYAICNYLKPVPASSSWGEDGTFSTARESEGIYFKIDGNITTEADLRTYLASHPLQFAYELATPIEINLTPTEIRTLKGNNNVWSDTGDTSVEYPADTKLYIDKKING